MRSDDRSDLRAYLSEKRAIVGQALEAYFPELEGPSSEVMRAMRYSLFAGGKRLRPILCVAAAEAVGGNGTDVLTVACALELIHTYSLIHDDLPVMDNDDLRRGKPTNHKVFGEAIALLAGDGLLTEAFNLMAATEIRGSVAPHALLRVIGLISRAAGYRGMVGGQAVDIQFEGREVDSSLVDFIHTHKTGALIEASVTSGALLGGGNERQLGAMSSYGRKIGHAFQISDDILNIEGDSETMGKSVGSDAKRGKITYPSVVGLKRSKQIQSELVEAAIASLQKFNHRAEPLREIAHYIIKRRI